MLASVLLICSILFSESKTLALQICLDRKGYSCNTIDGQWGRKSERALRRYLTNHGHPANPLPTPEAAYDLYFADEQDLFRIVTVSSDDLSRIIAIPPQAAARAQLPHMGYESIKEMMAERGHMTPRALERINPGVNWESVQPGLRLVIPNFPPMEEELAVWPKGRRHAPKRPEAAYVHVSLSNFEIIAYDKGGRFLALFPCSIARNKAKLPPHGELRITTPVARPNYTYTPDHTPKGKRPSRFIWPEGPNCPIGVAWLGLSLPGYGIHGTPRPTTIGSAESHGCFRLANWNAARLYGLCPAGTKVVIAQ